MSSPKSSLWLRPIRGGGGGGGVGITNNSLERKNGVHKQDLQYKKEDLTQYVQTAFEWLETESGRDREFSSKMAQGYSRTDPNTGHHINKRVWGQEFWSRVLSEFDRPDGLGVHQLCFKF